MTKDIDTQLLSKAEIIKATLKKFIRLYAGFNDLQALTPEEVAVKINKGDCGMTAIAVHHVLKNHYAIDTDIVLCRNHCWLMLDGVDYDTIHPGGYEGSAADHWEQEVGAPRHVVSFAEACDEWMPCDVVGAVIVKGLCTMYWTAFPQELQHCFDKADEYERPGELAKYEAKLQSVLEKL